MNPATKKNHLTKFICSFRKNVRSWVSDYYYFFDSVTSLSYQVMTTNVFSLLKTVKSAEDEAARGTRAIEAALDAISQAMAVSARE